MDAENPGAEPPDCAEALRAATELQPRQRPRLDRASRSRIGRELRSLYADLLDEPLSPRLSQLVTDLLASRSQELEP